MPGKERTPFGKRLYDARAGAKLTQKTVSANVGIAQSTLTEAEWSRDGSTYTAQLAALYGVRPEWLANGAGPMRDVSAWPFPEIGRDRFDRLEDWQRNEIQGLVRKAIFDFEVISRAKASGGSATSHPDQERWGG